MQLKSGAEFYFKTIDPTSLNKQGNDRGDQYRTGIYYTDDADESFVKYKVQELAKGYNRAVLVEILPLKNFYKAEDYHQDYLDKNPSGYCHIEPGLLNWLKMLTLFQKKLLIKNQLYEYKPINNLSFVLLIFFAEVKAKVNCNLFRY